LRLSLHIPACMLNSVLPSLLFIREAHLAL
jgi:hypothetical protein